MLLSVAAAASALTALVLIVVINTLDRWTAVTPALVAELFLALRIHGAAAVIAAAAALWVRRRSGCTPRTARLCLLFLVVLGVVFVDRLAAICFPPPSDLNSLLEPHSERGWAYRRNALGSESGVRARTNSLGLRGPDPPRTKPDGELRILFLGDSVTYGYGLSEEQTLSEQVQARLARSLPPHYRSVRGINAGVGGYTTWQERHLLEHDGLALQPDVVVLQFCLNDVVDVALIDPGSVHGRRITFEFSNTSHASGLIRAIASLRARRYWRQARDAVQWSDDRQRDYVRQHGAALDLFREPPSPAMAAAWQRILSDLSDFDRLCRDYRIPWLLLYTPPRSQFAPEAVGLDPQARLRAWTAERGIPWLDMAALIHDMCLRESRPPAEAFIDDGHPTPRTMSLIADAVAAALAELTLRAPSPSPSGRGSG